MAPDAWFRPHLLAPAPPPFRRGPGDSPRAMVTGNGQLRHALRERSAAAARFPHAYGGLLPARPGTSGIYFEYLCKLVTLVGLVCCFLGASGAEEYFSVRAGGRGRPLGALWPIFYNRTHPALELARVVIICLASTHTTLVSSLDTGACVCLAPCGGGAERRNLFPRAPLLERRHYDYHLERCKQRRAMTAYRPPSPPSAHPGSQCVTARTR